MEKLDPCELCRSEHLSLDASCASLWDPAEPSHLPVSANLIGRGNLFNCLKKKTKNELPGF